MIPTPRPDATFWRGCIRWGCYRYGWNLRCCKSEPLSLFAPCISVGPDLLQLLAKQLDLAPMGIFQEEVFAMGFRSFVLNVH